jgi:hypothetical protein
MAAQLIIAQATTAQHLQASLEASQGAAIGVRGLGLGDGRSGEHEAGSTGEGAQAIHPEWAALAREREELAGQNATGPSAPLHELH